VGISEDAQEEGQVMLKVAVVILVIMLAYGGIYSLMSIFVPKAMMGSAFNARTGKALDSVQDADYLGMLVGTHRQLGLYALTTTIAGFFVLFAGFRKAQKWAWWSFLVVGGIAWLWGMISAIIIVDKVNMPLQIIGMVLFLVGILIPIKAFFGKEAPEET
jgi:hypothetical protein